MDIKPDRSRSYHLRRLLIIDEEQMLEGIWGDFSAFSSAYHSMSGVIWETEFQRIDFKCTKASDKWLLATDPFHAAIIVSRFNGDPAAHAVGELIALADPFLEIVILHAYSRTAPSISDEIPAPRSSLLELRLPETPDGIFSLAESLSEKTISRRSRGRLNRAFHPGPGETSPRVPEDFRVNSPGSTHFQPIVESLDDSRLLRRIFEKLDIIIFVVEDESRRLIHANTHFREIFGDLGSPESVGAFHIMDAQGREVLSYSSCPFPQATGEKIVPQYVVFHEPSGRWFSVQTFHMTWDMDMAARLALAIDISPLKDAEAEVRRGCNGLEIQLKKSWSNLLDAESELNNCKDELSRRQEELELLNRQLIDTNGALSVLARNIDLEKKRVENRWASAVRSKIMPLIRRMRYDAKDNELVANLDVVQAHISSLANEMTGDARLAKVLTPAEMRVACLIREDWTTLDIAEQLNISISTVKTHRKNIRKKLQISKLSYNLANYLKAKIGN